MTVIFVFYLMCCVMPLVVLHGAAVQGTVLADDGPAVDAYDVPVGEGLADDAHGFLVEVGLVVGGYQDGTIDDEVVGIGGGEAVCWLLAFGNLLLAVVDGAGQRQAQQAVGPSVEGAQLLQFLFHEQEVGMVVVATRI